MDPWQSGRPFWTQGVQSFSVIGSVPLREEDLSRPDVPANSVSKWERTMDRLWGMDEIRELNRLQDEEQARIYAIEESFRQEIEQLQRRYAEPPIPMKWRALPDVKTVPRLWPWWVYWSAFWMLISLILIALMLIGQVK